MARAARNKDTGTTDKEEAFCQHIVGNIDCGDADAYRAAYNCARMKDKTVSDRACELKRMPHIQARLSLLRAERSERTNIDADYVLRRLAEVDQMDVIDIMDESGAFLPVRQWPKIWRQFISGMDVTELMQGSGDDRAVAGVLKKIKWPDKVKNLELIGKHVDVQAWKERHEVTGKNGGPIDVRQLTSEMDPVEASRLYREFINPTIGGK
jgi:phage terminase small subunit